MTFEKNNVLEQLTKLKPKHNSTLPQTGWVLHDYHFPAPQHHPPKLKLYQNEKS